MLRAFIEPTLCARLRCVPEIRTKTHATQPLSFTCTVFTELLSKQSSVLSPRRFEHRARARVAATSSASTPGCGHALGTIGGQYRTEAIQIVKVQRENSPGQYRRLEAETGTDRRQCSAPSSNQSNQHYVLGSAASLK